MLGRPVAVLCLVCLAGCGALDTESDRVVLRSSRGPDLEATWIRSKPDLERLALVPDDSTDRIAVASLVDLQLTIAQGLPQNHYVLLFDTAPREAPIRDARKRPLIGIRRIDAPWDRQSPTCSTWVSTTGGGGGALRAATRGICGGIAVLHSLLALDKVPRDQVVEGDHFKEDPLRRIQGPDRDRMSERRLVRLHQSAGLDRCESRGAGDGFVTSNRDGLKIFNRELARRVRDPDHQWDCTIFVRRKVGGRWTLAHFEHVESVRRQGEGLVIETTNGLDQGNQTDAVPISPGTNTWTSTPGGAPPFSLTGSTHPQANDYLRDIPKPNRVKLICCRSPGP